MIYNDASIKLKQDKIKNSVEYFILDTDISYYNDTIISHYAYSNIATLYSTFLSSSISTKYYEGINGVGTNGRNLYILRIDPSNQKIAPYTATSMNEYVYINIFYVKSKV